MKHKPKRYVSVNVHFVGATLSLKNFAQTFISTVHLIIINFQLYDWSDWGNISIIVVILEPPVVWPMSQVSCPLVIHMSWPRQSIIYI